MFPEGARIQEGSMSHKRILFWTEWRRIAGSVWGYAVVLIFLFVNVLSVVSYKKNFMEYTSYIADVVEETGIQMGEEFDSMLSGLAQDEQRDHLIHDTQGAEDTLEEYKASHIADVLSNREYAPVSEAYEKVLREKYRKLQPAINRLAAEDASLSAFAATDTPYLVQYFCQTYLHGIFLECFLLVLFVSCFFTGWDGICRMDFLVLGSRGGRDVQKSRFLAGGCHLIILLILLVGGSVGIFAGICGLGKIWDTSMSSQFLCWLVEDENIPFLTWIPFTFRGYAAASCLLGFFISLALYGMAYSISLIIWNMYGTVLTVVVLFAANLALVQVCLDDWRPVLYQCAQILPFSVWQVQKFWFTDGLAQYVVPWQELWQTAILYGETVLAAFIGKKLFEKRDIF